MVNQGIVNYLREGKRRGFSENILKQKLFGAGFRQKDIDDASAYLKNNGAKIVTNSPKKGMFDFGRSLPLTVSSNNLVKNKEKETQNIEKPKGPVKKKLQVNYLKLSGWMGAILILLYVIVMVLNLFIENIVSKILGVDLLVIILIIVPSTIICLFLYGFVKLGSEVNSSILKIGAWGAVGVYLGIFIFTIITSTIMKKSNILMLESIYLFLGVLLVGAILLMGLGLIKAGEQIKLARATGILKIILSILGIVLVISGAIAMFNIGPATAYKIAKGTTTFARENLGEKLGINGIIFGADFLAFWILMVLSLILEIKVMFNASKKFRANI